MICLELPSIPPSTNNAYVNLPRGGRTLGPVGRAYKTETTTFLARNYPEELRKLLPDVPYFLYVRVYLPAIENKSGKTRYKKVDVSNRLKLFEDCLKDAGGIDDSQFLMVLQEKRLAPPGIEATQAFLWNMEENDFHGVSNTLDTVSFRTLRSLAPL